MKSTPEQLSFVLFLPKKISLGKPSLAEICKLVTKNNDDYFPHVVPDRYVTIK